MALPAGAALELLHNFSLIHDDIEDGDRTRRGRPTLWAVWGVPQAINAGDALFSLAELAMLRLVDGGIPAAAIHQVMRLFNQTCYAITEGQYLGMIRDAGFEQVEIVDRLDYVQTSEEQPYKLASIRVRGVKKSET